MISVFVFFYFYYTVFDEKSFTLVYFMISFRLNKCFTWKNEQSVIGITMSNDICILSSYHQYHLLLLKHSIAENQWNGWVIGIPAIQSNVPKLNSMKKFSFSHQFQKVLFQSSIWILCEMQLSHIHSKL